MKIKKVRVFFYIYNFLSQAKDLWQRKLHYTQLVKHKRNPLFSVADLLQASFLKSINLGISMFPIFKEYLNILCGFEKIKISNI